MTILTPVSCGLSRSAIETVAAAARRNLGFEATDRIDVETCMERARGRIRIVDFWAPPDEHPSLVVKAGKPFVISLPMQSSPEWDRYVMAHELGHYYLHYRLADDVKLAPGDEFRASFGGDGLVEIEADWFAVCFLLPKERFEVVYSRNGMDRGRTADVFGVQEALVRARAETLNVDRG